MGLVDYTVDNHVVLLSLNDGENRFNPPFLDAFRQALDDIEAHTTATALVVHSTHEKIFSNGIDLQWLASILERRDLAEAKRFLYQLNGLFRRLLTYPLITVAAISGHAFAGGAILCCAFDFRLMRSDRGYFCLPEIDLGIPFLPGMNALLRQAVPEHLLREMELTGIRLTAEQCRENHVVRQACPGEELLEEALRFAHGINKRRTAVAEFKARLNNPIIQAIEVDDVACIESGRFTIN
jgi:enoyl-CoA hydratase/carnithine racemase